jgi:sialidase-1
LRIRPGIFDRARRAAPRLRRLLLDPLEDRQLLSAASPVQPLYRDLVSASVVSRQIFYNNSAFDGGNPAANAADDQAIATGKQALLPGGTASFANYTSYSSGINGVMVDIAGLPSSTLAASDFQFRVGNSDDPSTWAAAPAPASVTVRLGSGTAGAARVEIIWADGAISKQWLEVTVKATPSTGLATADTFYFGNAIGESGNSASDAIVDTLDVQGAANNPRSGANPASITFVYDYNRDTLVNSTDQFLAASNSTTPGTALALIHPPTVTSTPDAQRPPVALFNWGDAGYPVYNIPALVTTNSGAVLAFAEGRVSTQDPTGYAIVMRRSTDGGVSWSVPYAAASIDRATNNYVNGTVPIVDKVTGDIFLLYTQNSSSVFVVKSSDDGVSWSAPSDITASVKVTASGNPGPPGAYPNTPWDWYAVGPAHGIQLEHGAHAGRLIAAADHRLSGDTAATSWSHTIYSDDHGLTWHLGGGLDQTNSANENSNEATLVELANGDIYMSSRVQSDYVPYRGKSTSSDGGLTWSTMQIELDLSSKEVEGSLLRLNGNVLLFSSLNNAIGNQRHEMTIWISYDEGQNWIRGRTIDFGYAGYSDMTLVGPDTILLTYTRGRINGELFGGVSSTPLTFAETTLARVNLRWLQSSDPYQFAWYFNELPAGMPATATAPTIQDYGPWDQRGWAFSTSAPAQYVAGPAGDPALRLSAGNDEVVLSQGDTTALQFDIGDSYTVEIEFRTTDADGVLIGSRPTVKNWTLAVVGGRVQYSIFDSVHMPSITSDLAVNDGNWHRITAVHDIASHKLKLYLDGASAAADVTDTTTITRTLTDPLDPIVLGAYNDLSSASQLAVDVDMLRITRAALAPSAFVPADFQSPQPLAQPAPLANAPSAISGLQLWLPPYDPALYFADWYYADPMPIVPFDSMATRSTYESSANRYSVSSSSMFEALQYQGDDTIGSYWNFIASPGMPSGTELRVNGSSGLSSKNFNFVQNTGVFTLSTFVKIGASTGGAMTLFDTNEAQTSQAGFSLLRNTDGTLQLEISGGSANTVRFNDTSPAGSQLAAGQWYHVAVVGSGPGSPVRFYVTPVDAASVVPYNSATTLGGANGTYVTDSNHDLFIGGRSNTSTNQGAPGPGAAPLNGGMVNQAIFNRALSADEIQQLFNQGKGVAGYNVAATQQQPLTTTLLTFPARGINALPQNYAASINWGDGHVNSGTISLAAGLLTVAGSNTYALPGSYSVTVTVTNLVDQSSFSVVVTASVAPALDATGLAISPIQGRAFSGAVATFTDADADRTAQSYTAAIDWGDGSVTQGTISLASGVFTVAGMHTYGLAGSYAMTVTVEDLVDGEMSIAGATPIVREPLVASGVAIFPTTGDAFSGAVATFTDVDSGEPLNNYSATVHWGDGAATSGVVSFAAGIFTVSGTHTYLGGGSYPLDVTILDSNLGDTASASSTASVQQAITATPIDLTTVVGYLFNGAVAKFTTVAVGAPASNFSASIDWGDGQNNAGFVSKSGNVYTVAGSHTYATAGTRNVTVTINDFSGHSDVAHDTATVSLTTQIAARQLFYLRSPRYDVTNNNLPGFSDDNAIATDKTAYLGGSGATTFNSVSSYTRGINGIMVDIVGGHGAITANDFIFKVGNNNSPNLWATAAAPTLVTVRAGAGAGGSDRVELLWADGTIQKTWLEVIVRGQDSLGGSNGNTGLVASDVFFFGSAVADSGSGDTAAYQTNVTDEFSVRNDPHSGANLAPVTNKNDFNRDGLVNSTDQQTVRSNSNSVPAALKLLNLGGAGPFAPLVAPAAGATVIAATASVSSTPEGGLATSLILPPSAPPSSSAAAPPQAHRLATASAERDTAAAKFLVCEADSIMPRKRREAAGSGAHQAAVEQAFAEWQWRGRIG